jgi:hypothetical protein
MTIRGLLTMVVCLSCLGCRAADPASPKDAATTAVDPPAVAAPAESAPRNAAVHVYCFHQTFRCFTCQMLEEMAARVIQEHFAQPIRVGQVVWMPVNVDKPEGKVLRQEFNVRSSELVVARIEGGACKESKKLDELSELSGRPDAFSKYLVGAIAAYLSSAQGG